MRSRFSLYIGMLINLMVVSLPLIFINFQMREYLYNPITWIYYGLITAFYFLEGYVSLKLPYEHPTEIEKVFLPHVTGFVVLIIFWISIYDYAHILKGYLIRAVAGVLLVLLGIALRLASILKLKKYFVSHVGLIEDHKLITNGIYSIIRHPSELGLISICFGVSMLLCSINGILMNILVLLPLIRYRTFLEDKLLQLKFSHDYNAYRSCTPSFFPNLIKIYANKALQRPKQVVTR